MTLGEVADRGGRLCVLAIDHRDSLRAFLSPNDPERLAAAEITALKIELVTALAPVATGVMLEPEYSIPQVPDSGALPHGVGFIAALEAQGYLDDPGGAPTTLLDGWSPAAAADSGAAAAKLLLPYHPGRSLAAAQERVAASVLEACRAARIPLVLEPLFYDLDGPAERTRVVHATVDRFADLEPDLLKLPFPGDPEAHPATWPDACAWVTERSAIPWALLSGGGSFESFASQLEAATAAGCSGFMVGRALWGDAVRADASSRSEMLSSVVAARLESLVELVRSGPVGRGSSRIVGDTLAAAIVADDAARIEALLADGCTYRVGGEHLVGAEPVAARLASEASSHPPFDSRERHHRVVDELGLRRWAVDVVEHVDLDGESLVHTRRMDISVDPSGRVVAILDVTTDDELARGRAFFARHGRSQ